MRAAEWAHVCAIFFSVCLRRCFSYYDEEAKDDDGPGGALGLGGR